MSASIHLVKMVGHARILSEDTNVNVHVVIMAQHVYRMLMSALQAHAKMEAHVKME